MGILTQIVAADEDEIEAIGESQNPVDEWSGIEKRDIDIPKFATLHCLLTGDLYDDAAVLCEPIYVSTGDGALVLRLSEYLCERLAALDEEALEAVASELAATEEFEYADWPQEDIAEMLGELSDLARLAQSQGQGLFAWLHPLRT